MVKPAYRPPHCRKVMEWGNPQCPPALLADPGYWFSRYVCVHGHSCITAVDQGLLSFYTMQLGRLGKWGRLIILQMSLSCGLLLSGLIWNLQWMRPEWNWQWNDTLLPKSNYQLLSNYQFIATYKIQSMITFSEKARFKFCWPVFQFSHFSFSTHGSSFLFLYPPHFLINILKCLCHQNFHIRAGRIPFPWRKL